MKKGNKKKGSTSTPANIKRMKSARQSKEYYFVTRPIAVRLGQVAQGMCQEIASRYGVSRNKVIESAILVFDPETVFKK